MSPWVESVIRVEWTDAVGTRNTQEWCYSHQPLE